MKLEADYDKVLWRPTGSISFILKVCFVEDALISAEGHQDTRKDVLLYMSKGVCS